MVRSILPRLQSAVKGCLAEEGDHARVRVALDQREVEVPIEAVISVALGLGNLGHQGIERAQRFSGLEPPGLPTDVPSGGLDERREPRSDDGGRRDGIGEPQSDVMHNEVPVVPMDDVNVRIGSVREHAVRGQAHVVGELAPVEEQVPSARASAPHDGRRQLPVDALERGEVLVTVLAVLDVDVKGDLVLAQGESDVLGVVPWESANNRHRVGVVTVESLDLGHLLGADGKHPQPQAGQLERVVQEGAPSLRTRTGSPSHRRWIRVASGPRAAPTRGQGRMRRDQVPRAAGRRSNQPSRRRSRRISVKRGVSNPSTALRYGVDQGDEPVALLPRESEARVGDPRDRQLQAGSGVVASRREEVLLDLWARTLSILQAGSGGKARTVMGPRSSQGSVQ